MPALKLTDKRKVHLGRSMAACGTPVAGNVRLKLIRFAHLVTCGHCKKKLKKILGRLC